MALLEFPPSPALAAYILEYRVVHFPFGQNEVIPFKPYPPRPEICLSFYPRDTETVTYNNNGNKVAGLKVAIIGQPNEVTNRHVARDFLVFQVVFKPGAWFRITGIPAHEITNAYMDAETVFKKDIHLVNEQLYAATAYSNMVQIVEVFLNRQLHKSKKEQHPLDLVALQVLQADLYQNVDQLAKASFLSVRQLERKFQDRMGVSPKYYQKLVRFENAFRLKNQQPNLDWLSIAMQCGYHDYQHLVKDYKEFTLQTPAIFHELDKNAPERKFGEADTY